MNRYEKILKIFSERLKDLLDERNLSIKKFAEDIKIPRTTINNWILQIKSPKIYYVCEIADYFGVSLDYLLGRED